VSKDRDNVKVGKHTYKYIEYPTPLPDNYDYTGEVRNSRFLADNIASIFVRSMDVVVKKESNGNFAVYAKV
jgi:hypothetical protein